MSKAGSPVVCDDSTGTMDGMMDPGWLEYFVLPDWDLSGLPTYDWRRLAVSMRRKLGESWSELSISPLSPHGIG